jgi:integrase
MKNLLEFTPINALEQSGQEMAKKPAEQKARASGLARWKERVRKDTLAYYVNGPAGDYVVRIQVNRRRRCVQLLTADLKEAAERARQFYFDVKSKGWAEAALRLKPNAPKKLLSETTLGDYLKALEGSHLLDRTTLYDYWRKLRTLVAGVRKINVPEKEKFGSFKGPSPWCKLVDAVQFSELNPDDINEFVEKYVEDHGLDYSSRLKAKHTINSVVGNARALFSKKKILPFLKGIILPSPLPLEGVRKLRVKKGEFRFVPEVDPQVLLSLAVKELKKDKPALFIIFLLCLGAGLRRNEIDKLLWSRIDWSKNRVEVGRTSFSSAKSVASMRKTRVPSSFIEELRHFRGDAPHDAFVIPSTVEPRANGTYRHYRCKKEFTELCSWLHSNGIKNDEKKMHTLRKHFGDVICQEHGIYKASKALGHASVLVTEMHYASEPEEVEVPFRLTLPMQKGAR